MRRSIFALTLMVVFLMTLIITSVIQKKAFITWPEHRGSIQYLSGVETKGSTIVIADEMIKLPDDVYVKAYVVDADPIEGHHDIGKHLPWYALQKGDSTIVISEKTGFVLNLAVSDDTKEPFHFLKRYIQGYLEGVETRI